MLTLQEHDPILNDADDDDGMPPLVDNPNPSMTFTFFTDMTPITAFSADPTVAFETVWDSPVRPETPIEAAEPFERQPAYNGGPERTSHNKKRDSSYIPRPPNAFILFRSSFIKSQQVPEKVEGNHSTLSKIIGALSLLSSLLRDIDFWYFLCTGKYWKTLPREEREVWEAKAVVAQAEHRRRYPDWRFRPGANALAKLKVKDGPANTRRRTSHTGRKGRIESAASKKNDDARCAIIADLLVEGKTGVDLEDALRKWEDSKRNGVAHSNEARLIEERKCGGDEASTELKKEGVICEGRFRDNSLTSRNYGDQHHDSPHPRSRTPDAVDNRFKIPLTAMFRRSLSAPASHSPLEPQPSLPTNPCHDLLEGAFVSISYETFEPQLSSSCNSPLCSCAMGGQRHQHEIARAMLGEPISDLSPLVLPSTLGEGVPRRWNDPHNLLKESMRAPPSPSPAYTLSSALEQPSAAYGLMDPDETNISTASLGEVPCYRSYGVLMKDWSDSCISPHTQLPVLVNEFGGQTVYDWYSGGDGEAMFVTAPTPTEYVTSALGGVEVVRVRGGSPATVTY
ncbi:hypothetical protein EDD16DRAFT_1018250 [Pisolithus croceorrhizus]|nr:hypothetical protein EDD16DRAFT_1018250 [Pisolithus croceorrhizus]